MYIKARIKAVLGIFLLRTSKHIHKNIYVYIFIYIYIYIYICSDEEFYSNRQHFWHFSNFPDFSRFVRFQWTLRFYFYFLPSPLPQLNSPHSTYDTITRTGNVYIYIYIEHHSSYAFELWASYAFVLVNEVQTASLKKSRFFIWYEKWRNILKRMKNPFSDIWFLRYGRSKFL